MKIFYYIKEISAYADTMKKKNKTIGFVPTMGALHKAHKSLIDRAKHENGIAVCSIFVNPIQFNDKKDFEIYPRDIKKDIEMLRKADCDVLFAPSVEEMYPEPDNTIFDLGGLDKNMEGKYRKNHFNGVAVVVNKLFDIVKPGRAYFGEKDFQQLSVIKYLTKKYDIPVEIVACPTLREPDGLAISSRNVNLTINERKIAPVIYKTLQGIKLKAENCSVVKELKDFVSEEMKKHPLLKPEYFEIAEADTLEHTDKLVRGKKYVACIAVYLGKVRLIDNILLD